MEREISGMLMHSRVPGCFPGRSCAAGRAVPSTGRLPRWDREDHSGERSRRRAPWGSVRGGVVRQPFAAPRPPSPTGNIGAWAVQPCCSVWRPVGSPFPCGVFSVHACAARLRTGPEEAQWELAPVSRIYYFFLNH